MRCSQRAAWPPHAIVNHRLRSGRLVSLPGPATPPPRSPQRASAPLLAAPLPSGRPRAAPGVRHVSALYGTALDSSTGRQGTPVGAPAGAGAGLRGDEEPLSGGPARRRPRRQAQCGHWPQSASARPTTSWTNRAAPARAGAARRPYRAAARTVAGCRGSPEAAQAGDTRRERHAPALTGLPRRPEGAPRAHPKQCEGDGHQSRGATARGTRWPVLCCRRVPQGAARHGRRGAGATRREDAREAAAAETAVDDSVRWACRSLAAPHSSTAAQQRPACRAKRARASAVLAARRPGATPALHDVGLFC